jgi:steroid delta-isomerase-like uncharacterized protein
MQTFVRRNRGLVAATVTIALVVVLGAATSAWQWRRAEQARRAEAELRKEAEAKAEAESKAKEESNQRQVSSVQFSPDGKRIITTSSNQTVRIWDAVTGKPVDVAPERNKAIIRRYFDEWANQGNAAVADELIATNLVLRNPPAIIRSLEDYKNGIAKFHAAFPDAHYAVEEQIAERDKVVVRWTLQATQAKEDQGHAPSAKTMTVSGISIFRIANGKIQEVWVNMDRLGMMEQLGWMPSAAPPPK